MSIFNGEGTKDAFKLALKKTNWYVLKANNESDVQKRDGDTHIEFFYSSLSDLIKRLVCNLAKSTVSSHINSFSSTHTYPLIAPLARRPHEHSPHTGKKKKNSHLCAPLLYLLLLLLPRSAPSSPLVFPPPPPLVPISRYVVSWVCLVARFKITDPFCVYIFFIFYLFFSSYLLQHTSCRFTRPRREYSFSPDAHAVCLVSLPRCVSSQAIPCSDLFQCVVASRVCVAFVALPSKVQTFQGSQQYNMAALL